MPLRLLPALLIVLAGCSSLPAPEPTPNPQTPPSPPVQSVYDVVSGAEDLSVLTTLIEGAGLTSALDDDTLTLFAPSDEAFAALPAGTVEAWLQPQQRGALVTHLSRHLVPGRITSSDLRNGQTLRTLRGEMLRVRIANGRIQVGSATLVTSNVMARNGLVHVVDTVLTP